MRGQKTRAEHFKGDLPQLGSVELRHPLLDRTVTHAVSRIKATTFVFMYNGHYLPLQLLQNRLIWISRHGVSWATGCTQRVNSPEPSHEYPKVCLPNGKGLYPQPIVLRRSRSCSLNWNNLWISRLQVHELHPINLWPSKNWIRPSRA